MAETNPIAFAENLRTVLARYIATTLPISRRYPKLAREFRTLLDQEQLVQGPFVEALPDFEKGKPLSALVKSAGGFLHDALATLPTAGRPLHKHQEEALRRAVVDLESLLTATGTGSGKTETFLYPIAHDLLSDPQPERPGVRALLVYPMNALANDQLYYRIAPLFGRYLKEYGITFGRYTGQVKSTATRDEEEERIWNNPKLMEALGNPASIPSNWMLTRDEMLADPPKVLITNYAMLEHMLLLPRNAGLFATNSLRFIVLDEIHTYYGAQATEVAFLLRKLKTRLGVSDRLRVFGTSASLSDSPNANQELIQFASDLLGEPVATVVRGRRITHAELTKPAASEFSMTAGQWQLLGQVLRDFVSMDRDEQTVDAWNRHATSIDGLPVDVRIEAELNESAPAHLVDIFSRSAQVRRVAELLDSGRVVRYEDLAQQLFPEHISGSALAQSALSAVIQAGMVAKRSPSEFPLLPGRYHIAVNSIEGVTVLPDASGEGWAKVKVARSYSDAEGHYFPLLTCRKCGQPFLEGWKRDTHVLARRPDSGESGAERIVFWLGAPTGGTEDEADDPDEESGQDAKGGSDNRIFVQLKTGAIDPSEGAVALHPVHTETDELERVQYVRRCPACGGRASGADAEVVTRMHPGNESLGAVVAQRVLEALPPAIVDHSDPRPSFGRSLLTFSDNRQDAAFFAPYFERTAASIAMRSAVRGVLSDSTAAMPLTQLADRVFDHWQRDGGQPLLVDYGGKLQRDRHDISRLLLGALGYEFCTPSGRRNSLESLGLAYVTYDENKLKALYQQVKTYWLKTLPDEPEVVASLCHILLETIRRERALESLSGLPMSDVSVWGDYNQHRTFDIDTGDNGARFKWLPGRQVNRHNRRSWYLLEQLGLEREEALAFLRKFWESMTRHPVSILKKYAPGFGMDGGLVRVRNGLTKPLYQCGSCGLFQRHVVKNKCTAYKCKGEVVQLSDEERQVLRRENHYLATYEEDDHLTLRASEHTASLSTALREDIEREFSERRLNLLSCTTTMEMGVDLGDLEAVVNLNVPPGIANYQQRTGRAGRRAQAAPFCVTVARNTNYDQLVFRDLKGYLGLAPATPFINLANEELFVRHQMSVVLSRFLRHALSKQDINAPSLKHMFGDVLHERAKVEFFDRLYAWTDSDDGMAALAESEQLGERLPADLRNLVWTGAALKDLVVSRLKEFAEDVAERCQSYVAKKSEAAAADEMKRAAYWQEQLAKYMDQYLVNELSRRGLIPTYSFPVHSLNLEVQDGTTFNRYKQEADVSLNRDASLGISEYAPGAEVVANGRIWQSSGLASYPKAFMPTRWYAACSACFHVDVADTHQELPDVCSNCNDPESSRRKRPYVEPKGFVTSVADGNGKDPGTSRRRVRPADEARLIAAPRPEEFEATDVPYLQTALLLARGKEGTDLRGSLFVANRGTYGEGYYRCTVCNFCEPVSKTKKKQGSSKTAGSGQPTRKFIHKDPGSGKVCKQEVLPRQGLDFAHTFNTDVRLLRFVADLPGAPDGEMTQRNFEERIARTVAEACRLAASDLLHLHAGELRSTYRLYANGSINLEVVLYDGVPGGAGYSARLGSPLFSFPELMAATRRRLECPSQCDSACRLCLCDYSNQRYWDSFLRGHALAWLEQLAEGRDAAIGPGNYVRWNDPSLAGVAERFATYPTVNAIGMSLSGTGGYSEVALNQVLAWLQAGKEVRLYVANKVEERPKTYHALMLFRHLYPWLHSGKLHVHRLADGALRTETLLPRLFVGLDDGAPLVRQAFSAQGLLDGLLSGPAELGAVDSATRALLEPLLRTAVEYSADHFAEGSKMSMWEFPVGAPRPLAVVFAAVQSAHVKLLEIRDPYIATPRNRPRLKQFLQFLQGHLGAMLRVDVYCSEARTKLRDGTEHVESKLDVATQVERIYTDLAIPAGDVMVKDLGRNKTFHDRELTFVATKSDGCDVTHRYFLTGGVDYLLDVNSDTKVFHAETSD